MHKAMFIISAIRPRDNGGVQVLPCRSAPVY